MIINPIWTTELTIIEYGENIFDPNRNGFFITQGQKKEFNVVESLLPVELAVIIEKIFTSLVLDAQRLINFYIYNRLEFLPNGYADLKVKIQQKIRLAIYKQIQYAQYNRGNFVESDGTTQYSQGSQSNIVVAPSSNIFASDSLCLESRNFIDFTGIRSERLVVWWPLVTDLPLPIQND